MRELEDENIQLQEAADLQRQQIHQQQEQIDLQQQQIVGQRQQLELEHEREIEHEKERGDLAVEVEQWMMTATQAGEQLVWANAQLTELQAAETAKGAGVTQASQTSPRPAAVTHTSQTSPKPAAVTQASQTSPKPSGLQLTPAPAQEPEVVPKPSPNKTPLGKKPGVAGKHRRSQLVGTQAIPTTT